MAVVVLVAWPENLRAQRALQPVNLRCEERVNPLGIGNTRPGLSWQLQSSGPGTAYRGETQSAFEIQVGSTAGTADLWDSGKVASSQTLAIIYAGQPFTSGKQCFWQVRGDGGRDKVSAWSGAGQMSVGLL